MFTMQRKTKEDRNININIHICFYCFLKFLPFSNVLYKSVFIVFHCFVIIESHPESSWQYRNVINNKPLQRKGDGRRKPYCGYFECPGFHSLLALHHSRLQKPVWLLLCKGIAPCPCSGAGCSRAGSSGDGLHSAGKFHQISLHTFKIRPEEGSLGEEEAFMELPLPERAQMLEIGTGLSWKQELHSLIKAAEMLQHFSACVPP